jgi:hypothetical protein
MACSKIFLGELPELLSDIIQYFRSDFSTLHSCILVNRLWCRLTISFLWENPFSIISRRNRYLIYPVEYHKVRFIETYLVSNLNDNDKIKLNEYGINHLFSSNTLFNYPSYIRHLDTRLFNNCIENWVAAVKKSGQPLHIFIKNTQNSVLIKFICKLLIKIFIENEANLHTFDVTQRHKYFNILSELVLQSSNFICNIRNLNLDICSTINSMNPLLKFLSSNCNSISSLYLPRSDKYKDSTTIEYLTQLVKSQNDLKKIIYNETFPHSMLLNSNCINTLNTIVFCDVDFKNINGLNEVFEQLNVLESIHMIYCKSLDSNFIQQIINITKPFKLKSLIIKNEPITEPQLILQKSGDYLENFGFVLCEDYEANDESEAQLFKLIAKYCMKIKFFKLVKLTHQNIYPAFNLIENIKQNLNYLTINLNSYVALYFSNRDVELSSIVLKNLGQILPFKLEYLELSLVLNVCDFEIFLKNSQNTFIKKLLITNMANRTYEEERQDDMLHYIKEYIMKKERVKYFAFKTLFTGRWFQDELFYSKDELKEFRLHNIIVQKHNELKIQISEFLNENTSY